MTGWLNCKDVSALVSQSMDRRLSWWERCKVQVHLLYCRACTRFNRQMAFLRSAARRYAEYCAQIQDQAQLSLPARERIQRALRVK